MKSQQGAVLIVGLVVLLVMTLIGVSSMGSSTSQLKMANNLQTQQVSFQATETVAAFFDDGKNKTDNPYGVNWDTDATQNFPGLDPMGDAKTTTDLVVVYVDCMTVPTDQGLTGDSQDGQSGGFRGLARDLQFSSTALNTGGQPIGQKNSRVNGVQTLAPGCPN